MGRNSKYYGFLIVGVGDFNNDGLQDLFFAGKFKHQAALFIWLHIGSQDIQHEIVVFYQMCRYGLADKCRRKG